MTTTRAAFVDLPSSQFPFAVDLFDEQTGEHLHHATVTGPGALTIPGFAPRRVIVELSWPDGTKTRQSL